MFLLALDGFSERTCRVAHQCERRFIEFRHVVLQEAANGEQKEGMSSCPIRYAPFAIRRLPSRPHQAALLAAPVALLLGLALVVQLLALGDGEQKFGTAALVEI